MDHRLECIVSILQRIQISIYPRNQNDVPSLSHILFCFLAFQFKVLDISNQIFHIRDFIIRGNILEIILSHIVDRIFRCTYIPISHRKLSYMTERLIIHIVIELLIGQPYSLQHNPIRSSTERLSHRLISIPSFFYFLGSDNTIRVHNIEILRFSILGCLLQSFRYPRLF